MVLNYIWVAFFILAFVTGLVKLIFFGDMEVFPAMMNATFDMSKTGFETSLYLTGVLTLWMGLMRIGEKGGMVNILARLVAPLFVRIFPDVPRNHPAYGSIIMNLSANMLGLDNAATPMGLKAMKELQEVNPNKDTASNAQIMFLVLNTSGLTIIPVTIMAYRSQWGAINPADVFIPILLATFFSTMAGLLSVAFVQRINLLNKVVMAYLGTFSVLIGLALYSLSRMEQETIQTISLVSANLLLFTIIISFILMALRKRENVYDAFIEGAKDGFSTAVKIIPFLIAILVAVGVFRASGLLNIIIEGIAVAIHFIGFDTTFVEALPTAFMKPLSGSGARGLMIESMKTFGADSFVGRLSCIFQGAADTTFYILAVYFGSVGIKKTRHAVACGLIADLAGVIAAIFIAYLFFG
ncbi:MAG: nucleoside recognition domain-containing protein [Breznakibacter sp.]|nr:hypothetical protein [Breznakibacter sp.]